MLSALRRRGGGVKFFVAVVGGLVALPGLAMAQYEQQPAEVAQQQQAFTPMAPQQLDQLLGPIALYPDPLIAQVLPASTFPIDIVRAARAVRAGVTDQQIDAENWDPSVKAIAHYPSVLEMMDASIDWTQQLGQAFITQQDDVMQSIQRLRVQAQGLGNLVSTQQQTVLYDDDAVRIVPANPQVIYVPTYESSLVYYQRPVAWGGFINFGFGLPCGLWLDLDCDWHDRWFYRPGWSWNHWNDHLIIDRGRIIRHDHDGFRPGVRPSTVWYRNSHKPITFPGHRLSNPSQFEPYRGRGNDNRRSPAPHAPVIARPQNVDRGRGPDRHDAPNVIVQPQNRPGDRKQQDRGQSPRQDQGQDRGRGPRNDTPRPAVSPVAPATPAAPTRQIQAAPPAMTRPVSPATPAHIATPPVHVSPPPAASPFTNRPGYVQSPQPRSTSAPSPSPAQHATPSPAPSHPAPSPEPRGGPGGNDGNKGHR